MFNKICQICSIAFESKASNAKYCPECRKDEIEFRKQAKEAYEATNEDTFINNPIL